MQPTRDLLTRLQADYSDIHFVAGSDYRWSSADRTLEYAHAERNTLYLLHELAHALLDHTTFRLDIELLSQERAAWDLVRDDLAQRYDVLYDHRAEEALETYRDWLHARSTCPRCRQTGLQTKTSTYVCINCRCSWRPNDARRCALRRYEVA